MDAEELKQRIGANIAAFRKENGLTQAELANRLNYSDKAVSKWERGESIPDVLILAQLASEFGITVDTLLGLAAVPRQPEPEKPRADRRVIQMLSSLLVWGVALLVFVVLSSVNVPKSWVSFAYAVPVNAIVLLSLRSAWRNFRLNCALISVIVWSCLFGIYLTLLLFAHANVWRVFLLGIPGQLAVLLWFRLFPENG